MLPLGRSSSFGEQPSPLRAQSPLLDRASSGLLVRHGRRSGAMRTDGGEVEVHPHRTSLEDHSAASSRQWGTDTGSNAAHAVEEPDAQLDDYLPVSQIEQLEGTSRASSLAPTTTRQGEPQHPGLLDQLDIHAIVSSSMDEATRSLSRHNSSVLSHYSEQQQQQQQQHQQQQQQQQYLPPSSAVPIQHGSISESSEASEAGCQPPDLGHEQHVINELQPQQLQQGNKMRLREETGGASEEASETDSSEGSTTSTASKEGESESEGETGSDSLTSASSVLDPAAVYPPSEAPQTAKKRWASSSFEDEEEGGKDGNDVTHPSTLNPFFSLSPEALAEEARLNQARLEEQALEQQQEEQLHEDLRREEEAQAQLYGEHEQRQQEEEEGSTKSAQEQHSQTESGPLGSALKQAGGDNPPTPQAPRQGVQRRSSAKTRMPLADALQLLLQDQDSPPGSSAQQDLPTSGSHAQQPGGPTKGPPEPVPELEEEGSFVMEAAPPKQQQQQEQQQQQRQQQQQQQQEAHASPGLEGASPGATASTSTAAAGAESTPLDARPPIGRRESAVGEISLKGLPTVPPIQDLPQTEAEALAGLLGPWATDGGVNYARRGSGRGSEGGGGQQILASLLMSTRSESSVSSDGSSRHAPAAPAAAAERAKGPRSSVGSSSRLATAAPAAAVACTEGRRSSGGMAHTQGRRSSESTAHTEGRRSSGGTARTKGRQSSGGSSGVALGKAEGAGAHAGNGDDDGGGGGTSKGAPLGNSASNAHGATANGGSGGSDDGTNGVPTNNVASQGRGEEVGGESGKGDKRGRPGPQGAKGRAPKGMMASPPTVSTELALKAKAAAYLMRFQAEQALQGHTITGKGPSALAVVQHGKDGKKDGSLKPGELGAEYAWAMSNEVSEAKRSPRVSSAEDLGAEYSWATGAGQGGASTPAGQQARAGAKKGFKETGPTRHAHAPRSDRTSSGAAASKPTPASARVPATRGGASLPPSKRKAEDEAPTASPLPSTAGAHGDARTRGPITPGAAATAAAAALHARAGEHGAAGAAAAAALRAPQGGAAAAAANGGIGGDGPMQKLLAEFGKQPPPPPQQQQQQQRPASPKQNISAPKPGQQHMLPGTLHQHGKEEAADAYRKFAADDAHPSTAASAPLDLDCPPSPRTSAAAAAAAALGMRSTPNITMHDGTAASPAPYSSSRSSPPRTPTTAAAAAAAAALAPASRAGSGSPGRPANNTSASIAAILQTAPFALNPPELGIPSIPPPCHQPHGHAHTPLSPNHEAPNPYTGPFHHSSSMLPSSPPSNHAAYAADAMLNKPDWARPVHTTSQGMPDPHVPRVPGVGYPGPVHVVVPTDPMPSPLLSPLTSPRGLPPSTYGASLGVPPPPITYGAGIGVPSSPPSAYGASMGVAPPTPSTFGASMGVPSPPPNTYSAGMGAPPPPSTYSASMGVPHPPPSTCSAGMGAAPFYPQVYPGSLQQDAGVAPSNMQGPQVGPLPVQQQQQQQQQGLRQQQLQRQPEADVAQVLQQLQSLGYTVPEHAAQVLQILLKDANRNDLSSGGALKDPQGVAQQLWAAGDGPSPTSAGPGLQPPISQARPQESTQALQQQQQQLLHQHQHQHQQHYHPHSHLQGIQEDSAEEDGRDPIPQGPEGVAKEDLPGRGTQELRGTKSRRSSNAGSEMHAGSVSSSAQQSFSGWVRAPAAQQGRTSRSSQHRPDDPQEGRPGSPGGVFDPAGEGSARLAAIALMRHQEKTASAAANAATAAAAAAQNAAKPLLEGSPHTEASIPGHLAERVMAAHADAEQQRSHAAQSATEEEPLEPPHSLLQERRQRVAMARQRAAKAEAAQRRAPSAPRKGPASGSTQGAARPLQRPSQPQSPSRPARDSGPGAAGDYYHDTRGGKITMSGPSAMEAWRSASAPDKPPTTHTTPATGVPGAAGASALGGLHSWGKTGGGAGRAGPPKPGSRPSSPRTARSSPQRQLSKGRPVSPRVHGQARPLQVVGGGGSILDGVENGQQVVLLRPPKWQERDTRQWLSSLSLDLLPEEETAPMLENPLRNGVLLCDVAAAVTGAPIPNATCEPPDQQAARSNILLALDHLGLLDLFDDSQLEKMTKASPEDAKALIKSKHVNSYARGYAQKLKEQQLKVGMSLMVEVEKVLQGNQDATWGLLNHLRCICTGEAPSSRAPSRSSSRGTSPARPSSSKGRPSSPGQRASGPHVSTPKHNALTSAALPSSPPRAAVALRGPGPFASPQRSSRPASPSIRTSAGGTPQRVVRRSSRPSSPGAASFRPNSPPQSRRSVPGQWPMVPHGGSGQWELPEEEVGPTVIMASGVGPAQYLVGPRPVSPARRQQILLGLEQRQQKAELEAQKGAAAAAAQAAREEEERKRAWEMEQMKLEAIMSQAGGGNGQGPSLLGLPGTFQTPSSPRPPLTAWELLARPSYTRPTLPYSPAEIAALEASVVRWLVEMGALSRNVAAQGFSSLLPGLGDGVFLPWLVQYLTGTTLTGMNKKPVNEAARHANMLKAINHLRTLPNMSRRFLNFEEALLHAEHGVTLGLLEDLHRFADHQPPAGTSLVPGIPPYLPYLQQAAQAPPATPSNSGRAPPAYPQPQPTPPLLLQPQQYEQLQQQQQQQQEQQQRQQHLQQRLRASSPPPLRPPSPSPSKRPASAQPPLQQQQRRPQRPSSAPRVSSSRPSSTGPPPAPATTPELYVPHQHSSAWQQQQQQQLQPGPHPDLHCESPNSPIVTATTPWTDWATMTQPPSTQPASGPWSAGPQMPGPAPPTQSPAPVHGPHKSSDAPGPSAPAPGIGTNLRSSSTTTTTTTAAAAPRTPQRPVSAGRIPSIPRQPGVASQRGHDVRAPPLGFPPSHFSLSVTPTPATSRAAGPANVAAPAQSPTHHRPPSRGPRTTGERVEEPPGVSSDLDAYLQQQQQQLQVQPRRSVPSSSALSSARGLDVENVAHVRGPPSSLTKVTHT